MKSTSSLLKITWILFLTMLCVVSYTFAWFSVEYYVGNSLRYTKRLSIVSASNIVVENYYVTRQDQTDVFIEQNGTFALDNLAPNQTQQFKTVISNTNGDHAVRINLFIDRLSYTPALNNYLYVSVYSQSATQWYNYNSGYSETTALINGQQHELYQQTSVQIADSIEIQPNETVTIVWEILLNKNAGDDCQGAYVLINNLIIGLA